MLRRLETTVPLLLAAASGLAQGRRLALCVTILLSALPIHAQVLLFTKTAGFRHASISDGASLINSLTTEEGLWMVATEDAAVFNAVTLADYAVVVWLSTSGDVLDAAQQSAFQNYVEGGGGWLGIHAAADTEYDWPWYGDLLGNGAWFDSHPPIQPAQLSVESYYHPGSGTFPASFSFVEEWYNFQSNPRPVVDVVLTISESSYDPGPGAMGADHPLAWWHGVGSGRAFYTALGHRSQTYSDPDFREQIRGALLWAAGLLECPYPDTDVIETTVTAAESFRACRELEVRNTVVSGPGGDATFAAADGVRFDSGFAVHADGKATVHTGRSLFQPPP